MTYLNKNDSCLKGAGRLKKIRNKIDQQNYVK